jgi:energy-coupling factor transporter transmembrane protein EcfT
MGRIVRIVALFVLVIPGLIAACGIKLMRDTVFGIHDAPFTNLWVQFTVGLVFFLIGLSFVAGFIFHRDRKKNKVQVRFKTDEIKKGQ